MILMNDFRRQWQDTREDVLRAVDAVGESGWYITGAELKEFERALGEAWTLPYCAGVASGLDAIEISLRVLGLKPGDRVLTTPLSAFATTLAIVKAGGVPVFVDTDDFGLIDLDRCRDLLERRPGIRYLVPVHLYGNALDLHRLGALKERFDLAVVEDCAQSVGATHNGAMTGTVGQMAATSFYPTKNLGALGDGGAILTGDERLRAVAVALRDYGQSAKYRHDYIGYNSRLDELHAAILRRAFLPRLEAWTARRRAIAARYLEGIRHPGIRCVGEPPGVRSCFHLFPVLVDPARKTALIEHLKRAGIVTGEHYPLAITDQKAMAGVPHEKVGQAGPEGSPPALGRLNACSTEVEGDCANARRLAAAELSLPIHPYMTEGDVDSVIAAVNAWEG